MEFEELKTAWQSEPGIESERFENLIEQFHKGTKRIQSVILQRDKVETSLAVIFFVLLLVPLVAATNWTLRISLAFGCIGLLIIPFYLWWGRRSMHPPGGHFHAFVDSEISFLRRQIFLLKNIAWWYELPIGIGMLLFPFGAANRKFDTTGQVVLVFYEAFIVTVLVWVWWVNQRAVREYLRPWLDYHVRLREALDGGGSALDEIGQPPMGFVEKCPPPPMSKLERRLWIFGMVVASISVLAAGIWLMLRFDQRTGIFVAVCSPIVAALVFFMSGIWKRSVKQFPLDC